MHACGGPSGLTGRKRESRPWGEHSGFPGPSLRAALTLLAFLARYGFRSVQLSPRQGLAMPRPELVPRSEAARAARGRGWGCGLLTRLRCPRRAALGGSPRAGLGVRARSLPPRAQEKRPAPAPALSCRISVAGSGGRGGREGLMEEPRATRTRSGRSHRPKNQLHSRRGRRG